MRIAREEDNANQVINVSSLVDVMFILIIFFLATSTFKEEETDEQVNLPDTSESTSLTQSANKLIVINVRSSDRPANSPLYLVSSREMSVNDLQTVVGDAVKTNVDQKVLIRGDQQAMHGDVAGAVAACRRAGITKVNIGYDYNGSQPN